MKHFRYFFIAIIASLIVIGGCKESSHKAPVTTGKKTTDTMAVTDTTAKKTVADSAKTDTSSVKQVAKKKDIGVNRPLSLNFTLPILNGGSFTLHDHKGKVIVMDFWATWCGPCRREIPELIKLNDAFKKKGLLVVGVGLDNDPSKLLRFSKEYNIDYTILEGTQQIARAYGIQGIPTTYILDKKGRVIKRFVGYYPGIEREIRSIVKSALEE